VAAGIGEAPRKDPPDREEVLAPGALAVASRPRPSAAMATPGEPGREAASPRHITLRRDSDTNIGLNLDALDICGIIPGCVQEWNDSRPEPERLLVHDRIVEVNGVSGSIARILASLMTTEEWKMTISRPTELRVSVDCAKLSSLGVGLKHSTNSNTLLITEVGDGAIREWNSAAPGAKVCKHDRIISVNGICGGARSLLTAAASAGEGKLDLTVLHYDHPLR